MRALLIVKLIWEGKYDLDGNWTSPPRLKLPFQTVETINESAQQRQLSMDMFSADRRHHHREDSRTGILYGTAILSCSFNVTLL
jgi:hypothetical protein